jgi:hypothetical protein
MAIPTRAEVKTLVQDLMQLGVFAYMKALR